MTQQTDSQVARVAELTFVHRIERAKRSLTLFIWFTAAWAMLAVFAGLGFWFGLASRVEATLLLVVTAIFLVLAMAQRIQLDSLYRVRKEILQMLANGPIIPADSTDMSDQSMQNERFSQAQLTYEVRLLTAARDILTEESKNAVVSNMLDIFNRAYTQLEQRPEPTPADGFWHFRLKLYNMIKSGHLHNMVSADNLQWLGTTRSIPQIQSFLAAYASTIKDQITKHGDARLHDHTDS